MTARIPLTLTVSIECDDCHALVTFDPADPSQRVPCECPGTMWHLADTKEVTGTWVERLGTMDGHVETGA